MKNNKLKFNPVTM